MKKTLAVLMLLAASAAYGAPPQLAKAKTAGAKNYDPGLVFVLESVVILETGTLATKRLRFCEDAATRTSYYGAWPMPGNVVKAVGAGAAAADEAIGTLQDYGTIVAGCWKDSDAKMVRARSKGEKLLQKIGTLKGYGDVRGKFDRKTTHSVLFVEYLHTPLTRN